MPCIGRVGHLGVRGVPWPAIKTLTANPRPHRIKGLDGACGKDFPGDRTFEIKEQDHRAGRFEIVEFDIRAGDVRPTEKNA